MGLLLHLSDLHLVPPTDSDVTGDYKLSMVSIEQRQRRTSTIRNSLTALGRALEAEGRQVDVVVVTGDVSYRGETGGFALLPELLGCLGTALPEPSQVLICPGNHDVVRGSAPGSGDRYDGFLGLRGHGYTTALLEGIDVDRGNGKLLGSPPDPIAVASDGSFEVVALNSADMSNVRQDDEDALTPHLTALRSSSDPGVRALLDAWDERGYHDVARVQPEQLSAVAACLAGGAPAPAARVRFAALHHQLLPVGLAEEFKPFDGLTNLAEVRSFLAGNGVHAVLHGHKHEERVFEDFFVPYGVSQGTGLRRLVVISAPTVGHGAPAFGHVGRLIDVDPVHPTIAPMVARLVPAVGPGSPLSLRALPAEHVPATDPTPQRLGVLEEDDPDGVLRRLLVLGAGVADLPRPVVCRVRDGASALVIPPSYAGAPTDDRQSWFQDIVRWWQAADAGRTGRWNHGERIRSWDGALDQVGRAVAALADKPGSSRALVVLTDPAADLAAGAEFPAFVSAQFLLHEGVLDVVGYFRKQEMPHWWPVNVAELALLQRDVAIGLEDRDVPATAGSITTVTAMPVAGRPLPRVAVPSLDRFADSPTGVLPLLLPLLSEAVVPLEAVAAAESAWAAALTDWVPAGAGPAPDGDPVPIVGLDLLIATANELMAVLGVARTAAHAELVDVLTLLRAANVEYDQLRGDAGRRQRHEQWRDAVLPLVERLKQVVAALLHRDRGTPATA